MKITVTISDVFQCTLERAFRTPMLCDVTKVHTGYGLMPRVTHCTNDENWGMPGSSKKVHLAKSFTHKGGFGSVDHVVERIDNQYWKIQVDQFQSWMLGFYKFVGEWRTSEIAPGKVHVDYTYTLYAKNPLLYPFNWLFAKLFWRRYMRKVMENVRNLIENNAPYQYA